MRTACLAVMVIGSASCRMEVGTPLTPDRNVYQPGDSVALTLRNNSELVLGYNLCLSELRNALGERVDDRTESFCQANEVELAVGASVTGNQRPLPQSIPAGRYSYVTLVEHLGAQQESLESSPFEVVGAFVR